MIPSNFLRKLIIAFTIVVLIIGLYWCSRYSYLLFHGLVEMYIISIAMSTFLITWNNRAILTDGFLIILGVSFFFIGSVELLHTLAYKGMGVFTTFDANLPTQLWIAAGYMESAAFLLATFFIKRQLNSTHLFAICSLITTCILILIFSRHFPDCFIEGQGLTGFKKSSELVISSILLISGWKLYQKRLDFDSFVLKMILLGIGFNICARVAFILYVDVYGLSNQIGHYFQMIAFYCVYKAIIDTSLTRPQALLFREIDQQKRALEQAQQQLEQRIEERTRELVIANEKLSNEVSERIKIEALLNQRHTELLKINKELDDFAYIVSHDLREPLRGIHNFSNILLHQYGNAFDADGQYMLEHLSTLSKRMEDQIVAILNYSKIGREGMVFKKTDLNTIVKDVLDSLVYLIQEHRAEIRIPKPLPMALCDPVRIHEVFANLISNAVKYNDKPNPWVEIGYQQTDNHQKTDNGFSPFMTVYIKDNGIGIQPQHIEKIFLIFQRLHSQKTYQGTGVGLTISKKIIERHGGKIWVESVPGEGSTFYFTILKGVDEPSNSYH